MVKLVALFFVGMWCYAIYVALYLADKRDELTNTWLIVGIVPVAIGWAIDVLIFNWIVATILLVELPRERTFTSRLKRWYRDDLFDDHGPLNKWRRMYCDYWRMQLNALTPDALEHIP